LGHVMEHLLEMIARWPVSRVLSPPCGGGWPFLWDACRQAPRATDPDGDAETHPASPCGRPAIPTWSCSRWGLPCRRRCRKRGALLPHHFTLAARCARRRFGVGGMFLWHFPWGRPRRALPGTAFPWSPDFPLPQGSGHPAVWHRIIGGVAPAKSNVAALTGRLGGGEDAAHAIPSAARLLGHHCRRRPLRS